MRRADRLFQIILLLRGRKRTTAQWLARALEVSERTVYRDIQDLMCSGVPIEGEAGFGYVLPKTFELPPLMFSKSELHAISLGMGLVGMLAGSALEDSANSALAKIHAVVPLNTQTSKIFAVPHTKHTAMLDSVYHALHHHHKLHIHYTDKADAQSQRTILPLGLAFWSSGWTLTAWCEVRKDFRTFRLDRMAKLEMLPETFVPEKGKTFEDFLRKYNECYENIRV